jgi:hypothetical protein
MLLGVFLVLASRAAADAKGLVKTAAILVIKDHREELLVPDQHPEREALPVHLTVGKKIAG